MEIDSFCFKENCKHFYTSAKTGYNLNEAFEYLINDVLSRVKPEEIGGRKRKRKIIELSEQKEKKKKGCI